MSFSAIKWAMSQIVSKASAKFVLVAMADCVNGDDMMCWPSCKHLRDITGLDVKTVEAGLHRLRSEGLIEATGEHRGVTKQVVVYRLKTPVSGGIKTAYNTPVFPDNTPVFPVKHPQTSHETPPKTGDGTTKEPLIEPVKKKEDTAQAPTISDIPDSLMADFLKIRKAKKAPLTETAINGIRREAGKAGLTMTEAVTVSVERNWQAFKADWYTEPQNKIRGTGSSQKASPGKHSGFENLNYKEGINEDGTFA